MSRGVTAGRSFLFSLQKCAIFQYFAFLNRWVSLKKESLHTQSFSELLTVQPIHTQYGRKFDSLNRIGKHGFFVEYQIDLWKDGMELQLKTAVSLHRCAMIEKVFFDTRSVFAYLVLKDASPSVRGQSVCLSQLYISISDRNERELA
jgi:hypothetical protein